MLRRSEGRTQLLGDRFDSSETFNFEKRFGKYSEHHITKAKQMDRRVAEWQAEQSVGKWNGRPEQAGRLSKRLMNVSRKAK